MNLRDVHAEEASTQDSYRIDQLSVRLEDVLRGDMEMAVSRGGRWVKIKIGETLSLEKMLTEPRVSTAQLQQKATNRNMVHAHPSAVRNRTGNTGYRPARF